MRTAHIDKILLIDVVLLVLFGLVAVYSASVVESYKDFKYNSYYFYHQLLYGVAPGLVLAAAAYRVDYHLYKRYAPLFLVLALGALLAVFVPGIGGAAKGASRWIYVAGMSFQPSELAKLAFVIYLAAWLDGRKDKLRDPYQGAIPFVLLLGLVALPIIKQPDMGTMMVVCLVSFVMFFMAGARLKDLGGLVALGLATVALLIKIEPYRMERFTVFLNLSSPDVLQDSGWQINQALLALGSGGILGQGLGQSRQKFNYLPESMTDSIFAVMGEELGLLGLTLLLILFVILAVRGLGIAERARDNFGRLLATGITCWIVLQALINISAITALIPLTGVPLPFVSYGGSAEMMLLVGVGILLNISHSANSLKR